MWFRNELSSLAEVSLYRSADKPLTRIYNSYVKIKHTRCLPSLYRPWAVCSKHILFDLSSRIASKDTNDSVLRIGSRSGWELTNTPVPILSTNYLHTADEEDENEKKKKRRRSRRIRRNRKKSRRRWKRKAPFCKEPQINHRPAIRPSLATLNKSKTLYVFIRLPISPLPPLSLSLKLVFLIGFSNRDSCTNFPSLPFTSQLMNSPPFQLLTGAHLTITLHCWCLFIELQLSKAVRIHSQMDWTNKHKRKLIPRLAARNANT